MKYLRETVVDELEMSDGRGKKSSQMESRTIIISKDVEDVNFSTFSNHNYEFEVRASRPEKVTVKSRVGI